MATTVHSTRICVERFEHLDAQLGPFAAALALVVSTEPVRGRVAFAQILTAQRQTSVTAERAAREVARLRGAALADWPDRRHRFAKIASTLRCVEQWLYDLAEAEAVTGPPSLALGWMGEQAGNLGQEAAEAIEEIDAALTALMRQGHAVATPHPPWRGRRTRSIWC